MNIRDKGTFVLVFVALQMIFSNAAYATPEQSASEDKPPLGAVIDESLTEYYHVTTATGMDGSYWWIAGRWYNEKEMIKLPSSSRKPENGPHGNDGQDHKDKGKNKCKDKDKDKDKNKDKDDCDVEVPVSNWVIGGFVLTATVLQKAIKIVK